MAFLPPGNSADWSTLDIEFLSASCALTVARQNAEWRREYMDWKMTLLNERIKGREEGREEGKSEMVLEMLLSCLY